MRLIWMSAPTVFSGARPYNIHLTTHRTQLQTELSERVMRELGVPIVDAAKITRSRMDASYDGIHYANNGQEADEWVSQVSNMVYQVVLNTIFPDCDNQ